MDEQKVPVLTLNTQSGAQQALEQAVAQLEAPEAPNADNAVAAALDDNFSAEERAEIERFAGTIDVTNPDHVMLYGADAQKKVSEFADSILNTVKNTDSGEVGDILTNLITELKSFEGSTQKPKGLRGLFFNAKAQLAAVQARYDAVSQNVETISASLEQHQIQLLKDVAMFNRLYEMNLTYFRELSMYIMAGEMRLKEIREGDLEKGARIVFNAKTRRVSVCNALDCLIVHRERLADLPELCGPLAERQVVILADPPAYEALDGRYPGALLRHADEHSYGTEFLAYRMSIRTVGSLDEAVEHIARYSSRHSEAVVSENAGTIREFQQRVDAACVYANVSTAFTDGAQFGLGAEIGISTQKLHARGPMALRELTTYKYLIDGDGQTRA